MSDREDRARLTARVELIVLEDWDPLGIGPTNRWADEYRSYVGGIRDAALWASDEEALMEYLANLEERLTGDLGETDRRRDAARRLLRATQNHPAQELPGAQ